VPAGPASIAGLKGPERSEFQPGVSLGIKDDGEVKEARAGVIEIDGVEEVFFSPSTGIAGRGVAVNTAAREEKENEPERVSAR